MARPSGFRPRDLSERLALARHLLRGGPPPPEDADGLLAASAAVCGTRLANPTPAQRDAMANLGIDADVPADAPRVTVVICTYNRAAWLEAAIRSALAQSWPVDVLVVDDGSTDDTPACLAKFPQVASAAHPANRGKPAALDTALSHVHSEAFLVLDDDDCLLPGAVEVLARSLFADSALVAVFGDTLVFDDANGALLDWRPATSMPGVEARRTVLTTIPAMPGATLVRTASQRQIDRFEPSLVRGQDMDHYLRLSAVGPMERVPLPVLLYRRHDGLRGAANAQWHKHADPGQHRRRFLSCVQPVFERRWRESTHGRAEGFAWALGSFERELPDAARAELRRWPAPFDPHEAWVRTRCGLVTVASTGEASTLLLIDDGDAGALEATLSGRKHPGRLEVVLPRAHDLVGSAQIFWPGLYTVEATLCARTGLHDVALTSAPDWRPPAIDARHLPTLPPQDALLALSAAIGWKLPVQTRAIRGHRLHPVAQRCIDARTLPLNRALTAAADVLAALPNWIPARALTAHLCDRAGLTREAAELRA